nr:MAG TPA: hypothetical protein [Caudoviricetes sp.]DAI04345.1 MAG TPA: hypothetical protein [Caudoviricetes sp.]DAQ41382.1 MAG TPA: hypothetical protein [Caudoviricetes sp.]DAR53492.1 MAG TPA: hypothetical protein [Caudoviricetes sp.]
MEHYQVGGLFNVFIYGLGDVKSATNFIWKQRINICAHDWCHS